MKEINWVKLLEVFERSHADLVVSYLNAHGIQTEIIQEAYYEYQIGGAAFGPIQVLVPNVQFEKAQELYAESGWNFDTTVNDSDDEENEEE
jgi:hypothetical protein